MIVELSEKEAETVLDSLSGTLSGMTCRTDGGGEDARLMVETAAAKVKRACGAEWPRYVLRGCAVFNGWPVEAVTAIEHAVTSRLSGIGSCGREHSMYDMYKFLRDVWEMYESMLPAGMGEPSSDDMEGRVSEMVSSCRCVVKDTGDGRADLAVYNQGGQFPEGLIEYIALYEAIRHRVEPGDSAIVSYASYMDGIDPGDVDIDSISDLNGGIAYVSMVGITQQRRSSMDYAGVAKAVLREVIAAGGGPLVMDAYEMLSICCSECIFDRELVEMGLKLVDMVQPDNQLYTEYEIRNGMTPFLKDTLSRMDRDEYNDGPRG